MFVYKYIFLLLSIIYLISDRSLSACYFLNTSFLSFLLSGGGITHSLSWHRKGDRIAGCKLYARVWTPEDPRKTFDNELYTTEQTRL